jgi:hypothetical protein
VQSTLSDEAEIECLIQGLRLVTPCTQRIDLARIRGDLFGSIGRSPSS